jgi:hypothetical protein
MSEIKTCGKRHDRIQQDAILRLVSHVRQSKFLDLPGAYDNQPCLEHDSSEGTLRVRFYGREKLVGTCGAPPIVGELTDEVLLDVRVWRWTFLDPDELRLRIAHGWHISEHMPKIMEEAIAWDADGIIRALISDGANVNGLNSDGEHFLMGAVRTNRPRAAQALLDAGADWRIEETYGGENPAINAAFRSPEMVSLFLKKRADVNAISSQGRTMLMNAASQTNPSTVEFLVTSGADVNIRNPEGESALSIAQQYRKKYWYGSPEASRKSQEIIDYLVSRGAVP